MTRDRSIIVASADRLFAEAAASYLSGTDGWRVTGIAGDGMQALALVARTEASRLLVIGELPRLPARALVKQVRRRSPEVAVVVVGADAGDATALDPRVDARTLLRALTADATTPTEARPPGPDGLSRLRSLTPRELLVLKLLTQGATREEIAEHLHVSRHTVRTHVQNLYTKLDLHSGVQLVKFGAQHGLVSGDRPPTPPAGS